MHRPRKRFGQHFLHDPAILDRITAAIAPAPGDRLVEIGPGQGALTAPLLEQAGHLDVIEIDRDLAAALPKMLGFPQGLAVHCADILEFDLGILSSDQDRPLRITGNLPYNISTPLLFHLIAQIDRVHDMHFLVQKEVADRLAAPAATADRGRLSVMIQYHCRVERLFGVGPDAFRPPPRVESTFIRLVPWRPLPHPARDPARLSALVRQAFSMRRKTLRNALASLLPVEHITACGIDPARRPETLTVEEFVRLSDME